MSVSLRFKEMRARLSELRKNMLPSMFSLTGDYNERQLDRAIGYRLLVHAEIESYLEDVSRDVVTSAISQWKNNGKPSSILIALLASYHSSWHVSDEVSNEEIMKIAKSRKNIKDSVSEVIELAQTQYVTRLKNNHGIKDNNFKMLILPTGICIDDLDSTWLTNLDSFGAKRGEVAHKSKMATEQINPQDEYNLVSGLLRGLEDLDRRMVAIKKAAK